MIGWLYKNRLLAERPLKPTAGLAEMKKKR